MQPVGFDGVYDADAYIGGAARKSGIEACKVILYERVFFIPRGLIVYRGGVIALCLALHGDPRKVRNAHGDAERRLPVALKLVTAEVEIPVRHAVKLAHHALAPVLVRDGCRLLGGGVFVSVGKHIYSRQRKGAQRTHCLADSRGLRAESRLLHHVSGEGDAVRVAP